MSGDGQALRWTGKVLAEEDLRRNLNGQRVVVLARETIVTPSAEEFLRAGGIRLDRDDKGVTARSTWAYTQDRVYPLVLEAVFATRRDGLHLMELPGMAMEDPCRWSVAVAKSLACSECRGGIAFCEDPALVCCVANKVPGLRAAAITTVARAARATAALRANLLAVEMPGRTYFEVRQLLRILCASAGTCPAAVAATLEELDGHAHR